MQEQDSVFQPFMIVILSLLIAYILTAFVVFLDYILFK